MLLWLISAALAHPMAGTDRSLRTAVRLGDTLEVVVVLEVPIEEVRADVTRWREQSPDGDGAVFKADYTQARFALLARTTRVWLDGVPVELALEPLDTPVNGRGLEGFFTYVVAGSLPAPTGASATVRVELGACADGEDLWFSGLARAVHPWKVATSSAEAVLGRTVDAEAVTRDPALWTQDDALRTLEVTWTR